ncbi:MAG: biotin--[acetyl-CoA-carboxylase] ligase [Reichenbachiella sp.]|uniref:biotin--[acetyl-CoA-carboxylase] ligase n=1 Tax=Reichenbachiella sp. TaxID=2184521 RepID=UPI003267426E
MHKFFAKPHFLGKKVIYLSHCHSTNETAAALLKEKPQIEGTTVITNHQTNGKGQRGSTWESEAGKNATFSVILKPSMVAANQQFQLHLITTLAIHAALFPFLGKKLKIKWPNDIYYGDRKLGGILIENSLKGHAIEASIVGIGLNVNQKTFNEPKAISLTEIVGDEFEVNELIEQILIQLEKTYLVLRSGDMKKLKSQYLRRLYRYMSKANYEIPGRTVKGTIVGVTDSGHLQLKEDEVTHEFDFKEVSYR